MIKEKENSVSCGFKDCTFKCYHNEPHQENSSCGEECPNKMKCLSPQALEKHKEEIRKIKEVKGGGDGRFMADFEVPHLSAREGV